MAVTHDIDAELHWFARLIGPVRMVGRDGHPDAAERLADLRRDRGNHEACSQTDDKQAGGDGTGHRIAQRAGGPHGRR